MNSIKKGGMTSWLIQRITGAVLVIFLAVHFFITHYMGEENILFNNVKGRLETGTWKLFYVIFLLFALYHGLNGLRSVLIDFDFWKDKDGVLKVLLTIVGIAAFAVGVTTVYSV